ncbi:MAG: serine/threonine protein kinase, partial [Planctomycetes bacterium]|nr:serine/threonine protein kinase [Planctomycetota bacterium]
MNEPQPKEREEPREEAVPAAPVPSPEGNVVHPPEAAPSDDAPTIISTVPPRALRPEDGFLGLLRGRRLAHFELVEPIGVGGMAAVIRARDLQLDRIVALKILPPELATDPEAVRRFQQEARAAAKLDSENIARVYFCGEDQGLHFIAFEFVEGENLRTLLEERGRLPVPEAVHYLLQIVTGLAHAASRGVVHRDIKPSNIIISPNRRAKLVDMGLARSLEPHSDHALTQSGVTLGTFDYISPEQALEPREADVRSDIYSLGCTFYHMLTGQPPVPEGTAAKKLHHHQHVPPLDPRQLTPEIPDEVAAILARMMAKDPKDRYQRPEDLFRHLLQVAQKLGTTSEVPDGVLFVDAPLPNPPRMRPALVAVAAACVLATLIVLHAIAPWPVATPPGPSLAGRSHEATGGPVESVPPGPPIPAPSGKSEPATPSSPARSTYEVHNAKELARILEKEKEPEIDLQLLEDMDLTKESRDLDNGLAPGVVVDAQDRVVTLEPKDPQGHITIRLTYDGNLPTSSDASWTALTIRAIKGGKVTLRNLRFEVDATAAPATVMAALRLQESGQLILKNCEFIQVNPPSAAPSSPSSRDQGLSSILVDGARGPATKPHLTLENCYFGDSQGTGGQDAITVSRAADLIATNCTFGPHAAWFHFRDKATPDTDLALRGCSGFLVDGSAFYLEDDIQCQLNVEDSLFGRPESAPGTADLVHQVSHLAGLRFTGHGNRYYNLTDFWVGPSADEMASTWEEFRRKVVADDSSLPLSRRPWKNADPLALLKNEPQLAFQLDPKQPELRRAGKEQEQLVGPDTCAWFRLYEKGNLPPLGDQVETTAKVVDPDAREGRPWVYKTLNQAVLDAQPGDVILIKKTGEVPVEPVRLEKPTIDLTIKPYTGYRPILTLGDTTDQDATLFRLHDGQLKLEHLEFRLKPGTSGFIGQTVVTVAGFGQCQFKSCVATLD